jgi:hypothetical protein
MQTDGFDTRRCAARRAPPSWFLGLAALVLAVYGAGVAYHGGLSVPPIKDESQFWEQARAFAAIWPPSIEQIRNYQEPMTPIAFLLWAGFESWHGLGIAAARSLTALTSLVVLAMIALRRPAPGAERGTPLLCALGLLLYPYWLPMSLLLYTDVPATLFVVLGLWLYASDRHAASALLFAIAIGTRQYSVVFPAALAAYEALGALRAREVRWRHWVPYLLAAASLLAWHRFFGGWGPPQGLEKWERHSAALLDVRPDHALYFLSAIGAYFVVLEGALAKRWREFGGLVDRRAAFGIAAVVVLFALYPPNYPEGAGPLNRALLFVLGSSSVGEVARLAVLLGLACLSVVRFARFGLGTWIVAAQTALMPFVWSPWEKYCMPVLAALWLLTAAGRLDERDPPAHRR